MNTTVVASVETPVFDASRSECTMDTGRKVFVMVRVRREACVAWKDLYKARKLYVEQARMALSCNGTKTVCRDCAGTWSSRVLACASSRCHQMVEVAMLERWSDKAKQYHIPRGCEKAPRPKRKWKVGDSNLEVLRVR
jgi:hypothetical protein